jgi:hypothetical protein
MQLPLMFRASFGTHHIRAKVATTNGACCVAHKGRTSNGDVAAQLLDGTAIVCGLQQDMRLGSGPQALLQSCVFTIAVLSKPSK